MTKALLTFGVGSHAPLLDISRPLFIAYAEKHGYEYVEIANVSNERPLSWMKVQHLISALEAHDTVLWIDCDVIIFDGNEDIAAQVCADAWQALVLHHTNEGEIPNCGIWLLRQPMRPILLQLWSMTNYLHHCWWEQGAMLELLGYNPNTRPVVHGAATELYRRTHMLPLAWNSDEFHDRSSAPKFVHFPGVPLDWRIAFMRGHAQQLRQLRSLI